jgi:uncharacterized protein
VNDLVLTSIDRVATIDWTGVAATLDQQGAAMLPRLLHPAECDATTALYSIDSGFRSRVVMARHGF